MSYAGHIADMITRIKYNESLKQSHRNSYARIKEVYLEGIKYHIESKNETISPEKLEVVKQKIRAKMRKQRIIFYTLSTITTLLIVVPVIIYFYFQFFKMP